MSHIYYNPMRVKTETKQKQKAPLYTVFNMAIKTGLMCHRQSSISKNPEENSVYEYKSHDMGYHGLPGKMNSSTVYHY